MTTIKGIAESINIMGTRSGTAMKERNAAPIQEMAKEESAAGASYLDLNIGPARKDGVELMDYLLRRGEYTDASTAPRPGLILLDLNMPKKDGREALSEIKADKRLRHIPVVILTTSQAEEDILRTYDLGVNSFISKPVTFDALVDIVKTIGHYWIEIVSLPEEHIAK